MIGQTDRHLGDRGVGEVQRTCFDINGLVIHSIGLKIGRNRMPSHDRKPTVCIVEHHVGPVERTSDQHGRRCVGDRGIREVELSAGFNHQAGPETLSVRTLSCGNDG